MNDFNITSHDTHPRREAAIVDAGLEQANTSAAPLDEVRPISCFARGHMDQVIGGAVGRRWGHACELQQLWVEPRYRRRGIGGQLLRAFEAHAMAHGCRYFFLETFSFQAPQLYQRLGYAVRHEHTGFPGGIVKLIMSRQVENYPVEPDESS